MYLIAYQVRQTRGRSINAVRGDIEEEIVKFGSWWRYFGDVWIVDTEMTVDEMTQTLVNHLDQKDDLLIIGIQGPYQGWLPEDAWKWLDNAVRDQKLKVVS